MLLGRLGEGVRHWALGPKPNAQCHLQTRILHADYASNRSDAGRLGDSHACAWARVIRMGANRTA